jgi:hypothetical protein
MADVPLKVIFCALNRWSTAIDLALGSSCRGRYGCAKSSGRREVIGMGWHSIIVDPTGALLGLWQPKKR